MVANAITGNEVRILNSPRYCNGYETLNRVTEINLGRLGGVGLKHKSGDLP